MSVICRPKALEGDRTWATWEEAARFCSSTDYHRYHFRVKLGEKLEQYDGPDFSMFGEPVKGTASLPDTRANTPDICEHNTDLNTDYDTQPTTTTRSVDSYGNVIDINTIFNTQPTASSIHAECSEPKSVDSNDLACWCRSRPMTLVVVDGTTDIEGCIVNRACPAHPCWDQSCQVISVETICARPGPKHPANQPLYMGRQAVLYARYSAEAIPVIRSSAEYFAALFGDAKSTSAFESQADNSSRDQFPLMKLPTEIRLVVYGHVFPKDQALICTWPSPAPLPFTDDIDGDSCTDPMDYGVPWEYQDIAQFDDTEDFFLPKNLLAGVGLLTVNKLLNREASPFLYQQRTFRFNSHHLTKLLANRSLCDQLRHIELEDFGHNRFLNLVPVIKTLLGGKNIEDVTIGRNMAGWFLKCGAEVLAKRESYYAAQDQLYDFEQSNNALVRLKVGVLPKLSFYNFTKAQWWTRRGSARHAYVNRFGSQECAAGLDHKMCELGIRLSEVD